MISDHLLSWVLSLLLLLIIRRQFRRSDVTLGTTAILMHLVALVLLLVSSAGAVQAELRETAHDLGRGLTLCCVFLYVGRIGGAKSERRRHAGNHAPSHPA
jgi:hypothetical protein